MSTFRTPWRHWKSHQRLSRLEKTEYRCSRVHTILDLDMHTVSELDSIKTVTLDIPHVVITLVTGWAAYIILVSVFL